MESEWVWVYSVRREGIFAANIVLQGNFQLDRDGEVSKLYHSHILFGGSYSSKDATIYTREKTCKFFFHKRENRHGLSRFAHLNYVRHPPSPGPRAGRPRVTSKMLGGRARRCPAKMSSSSGAARGDACASGAAVAGSASAITAPQVSSSRSSQDSNSPPQAAEASSLSSPSLPSAVPAPPRDAVGCMGRSCTAVVPACSVGRGWVYWWAMSGRCLLQPPHDPQPLPHRVAASATCGCSLCARCCSPRLLQSPD